MALQIFNKNQIVIIKTLRSINLINQNNYRIWARLVCDRQCHTNSYQHMEENYCCKMGHKGYVPIA